MPASPRPAAIVREFTRRVAVVAFLSSIVAVAIGIGIVVWVMRRRPVGAPLTWGEAMLAATFVFFLMFLAYGVVPHQWLNWADSELRWRPDRIGIPAGPLSGDFHWGPLQMQGHTFWPKGVPLPNGHFVITAQTIRDIVATLIYVVFLGVQLLLWSMWQKRGQEKPAELPTSPYGRPLLRKT
jgi:hypothetical protein